MSQSVNLSVSGIYTALNDMNGLPPGALNIAQNVESQYKNTLQPRRGFEGLENSAITGANIVSLQDFTIAGTVKVVALTDAGNIYYYDASLLPANPWVAIPGLSDDIVNPNNTNARSRLIKSGQNLYVTSRNGIRSLASGTGSTMLRAGVPKGLNLEASTNGATDGFFNNNIVLTTTGNITASSALIKNINDYTGVQVGQYVTGTDIDATLVVQDLTYTSELFGVLGNSTTIAYTAGATAGAEVVSVVGSAISVQIEDGVSTATQIKTAIDASAPALALVSVAVSGTGSNAQSIASATPLAGGLDNTIPVGTKVAAITTESTILIQTGNTTAGSVTVSNLASNAGIIAGVLVSGDGIPSGAKVASISGSGPYSIDLNVACFQTATGTSITFTDPLEIELDNNALDTLTGTPLSFYTGSQVAYRVVYGRVETDANNNTTTRVGAASSIAIVNNITPYSTNVTVTGTLPKNSEDAITFVQVFRSEQTNSTSITPLDQYNLVYERSLESADFTNRVITITDSTPDSAKGIPLYSGSDREGILQSNNPPPIAYDMTTFRNFAIYGNCTQPSTLEFTIVSVGSPSGIQVGDEITIAGSFAGTSFSQTYVAANNEDQADREFEVVTSGTPAQNITSTTNSLIRVINYDDALPVHAILLSSTTDLPGQVLLEADHPSLDTFTVTANAHTSAYDPVLSNVSSQLNTINNGVYISKLDEIEAVPPLNLLRVGDSSSEILRVIALRDYVIVLKTDGIYKIQGLTPNGLVANAFDLTTKIIGPDTAVSLDSAVWMFSNQGVVKISDGGVEFKSIPIDDQLNELRGSLLDEITELGFAVGYESDRKLILSLPTNSTEATNTQYVFNYVTNSWTTWNRELRWGFVHSSEGKLYISRADALGNGVSKERKDGTYRQYVDEAIDLTIDSVTSSTVVVLNNAVNVEVGDILFQDNSVFSPITEVDTSTHTVTLLYGFDWSVGDIKVLKAIDCEVQFKQVFGDNPAYVRQFSEGLMLFKNTRFNSIRASFITDYSQNSDGVDLTGSSNGLWGLFPWGTIPWGGQIFPQNIRFYIPSSKQFGSYIIPILNIKQGYSDFKFQGMSLSWNPVSQEVGK